MRYASAPAIRLGLLTLAAVFLGGCTRLEDHASLSRRGVDDWTFTWTTIARRGVNLVDSSGNVGSASASFPCRPDPAEPRVWIVEGPPASWRADGGARDALGPPASSGWRGTIKLIPNGDGHILAVDLHNVATGRPFPGNGRFENARGNEESWFAK